jgi:DNA-binding response OmpR family regulator
MRKRILVADIPDSDRRLTEVLSGHELAFARTLGEAQRLLAQAGFDLIVVGVHFDDSRMFDLVRHVRSGGQNEPPVACVRSLHFFSTALSIEGLEIAAKALACALFLDLTQYPDDERGNAEVRRRLEALFTP